MQLRADKDGFLIGDPIELKDLLKEVSTITAELAEIKELLRGRGEISIAKGSINTLTNGIKTSIKSNLKGVNASNDGHKYERIQDRQTSNRLQPLAKTTKQESGENKPVSGIKTAQKTVVTPTTENNKIDKVTDKLATKIERRNNSLSQRVNEPKGKKTAVHDAPLRGANGRFLKKDKDGNYLPDDSARSDKDGIGGKLKNIGNNIVSGIGEIAGGSPDNSDPAVQAVGEIKNIFTPVGRGLGKIFTVGTGGVSRGQDRWYRRFFKQNEEKRRVDDVADKRQRQLLTGIYKKNTVVKGDNGFLATILFSFLSLLGAMLFKGFKSLLFPFVLLANLFSPILKPLLKALSSIAKALGLNRIFGSIGGRDRLGSPVPVGVGGKNGKNVPVPTTTGSKKPDSKPVPTAGKQQPKTMPKGGIRGLTQRIPWLGALITAGFLANDLNTISKNDELSTREKRQQKGGVIGSSAGGIGGAIAGATVGATVGTAVPVIGNVVGAIVGGIIGGISGSYIGDIIGEKFGGWTDSLINTDVGGKLVYGWRVATETMSLIWADFTAIASEKWDLFTQGLSLTWGFVSEFITSRWEAVVSGFTTAVDFIQKTWAGTTAIIGTTLTGIKTNLTALAKGVAENVKQYTGIDMPKHLNSLKTTVGGWVDTVKDAVKDTSSALKSGLGDLATNIKNSLVPSYLLRKVNEAQANVEVDMFRESAGQVHDSADIAPATGQVLGKSYNFKGGKAKPTSSGIQNTSIPNMTAEQKKNYDMIMDMMMSEGFTRSQAIALTAEVGRENDFSDKYLYSTHTDRANNATNIGMISWQGARAKELQNRLRAKGLLDAEGKMKQTPEALREQIKFMRHEIATKSEYSDTKNVFMNNPNANPEDYAYTLGNNYIGWAWGQHRLSSGELFPWMKHDEKRQGFKNYGLSRIGVAPSYGANFGGIDGIDPDSPEGILNSIGASASDGLGQIKLAFAEMFKTANEGGTIKRANIRTKAIVPAINDLKDGAKVAPAPQVQTPLATGGHNDSNDSIEDVSREVSDHRIAHIVTGAYSKN